MSEPGLVSPPLPPEKFRFLTEGLDTVQGFLIPSTALYLSALEWAQRGRIDGGVCEIGVHRGKSFLAMTVGLAGADPALAIDIFDAQHLNMEATSVNALRDFRRHLAAWDLQDRVQVHEGSSLDLEAEGFCDTGRRFRLFSVDGGHLAHHVLNDLRLAESTLVEGGIVAADDFVNQHYLGVITGIFEYLDSGGTLVPYALIPNKLLLTDAASVPANRAQLRELFGAGMTKADVPFHGVEIDVYGDTSWTVVDTEGSTAPLQRTPSDVPALRKLVDDQRGEIRGVSRALAAERAKVSRLTQQRRRLRQRVRRLEDAATPSGRADLLPAPLRAPARAAYRAIRRRR